MRNVGFLWLGLGLLFSTFTAHSGPDCDLKMIQAAPKVFIAGQPSADQIECIAGGGFKTVINSRLRGETEALAFDPVKLSQDHGMDYRHAPLGGEHYPLAPGQLDTFSEALDSALRTGQAPVLLHCGSGRRSAILMSAYLVRREQLTISEAIKQIGDSRVRARDVAKLLQGQ